MARVTRLSCVAFLLALTTSESSGTATFGRYHNHTCHCKPGIVCDVATGKCNGGCATGWSGPSCQRQNVALNQTVCDIHGKTLQKSVDGDRNQRCCESCAYTLEGHFEIHLSQAVPLYYMEIYSTNNDSYLSLNDFEVEIYQDTWDDCYKQNLNTPVYQQFFNCEKIMNGKKIRIFKGKTGYLIVCEVEIYVCEPYWWGESCEHECLCRDPNECNINKINVTCPSGCQVGWTGINCTDACKPGSYGDNCNKMCGSCFNGQACDPVTGVCPNHRCTPGWTGKTCKTECSDFWWGNGCKQQCRCKKKTEVCHKVTGKCTTGCLTGWKGDNCDSKCLSGKYGENCNLSCGKCMNNAICNYKNGACPGPCQLGWRRPACNEKKEIERHQDDANTPLLIALVLTILLLLGIIIFVIYKRKYFKQNRINGTEAAVEIALEPEHQERMDNVPSIQHNTNVPAALSSIYNNDGEQNGVKIKDLFLYIKEKINSDSAISTEFEFFTGGLTAPHDTAMKPENKVKNRFKNIVPYDHSRVILEQLPGNQSSDYINASYIDGFDMDFKYIASQGPTKFIVNDFWRMIWQVKCGKIVMLTNFFEGTKRKCDQYWPDKLAVEYGSIVVQLINTITYADFVIRDFEISKNKDTRKIKHFHFTSWPDHGIPPISNSLLVFYSKINSTMSDLSGPLVVHCSAGIGRTGTFIALNYLINQAESEGLVNIKDCVHKLRHQRVNMIQTMDQYKFLHIAVAEALLFSGMTIEISDLTQECEMLSQFNSAAIEGEYKLIDKSFLGQSSDAYSKATKDENKDKNGNSSILPHEHCFYRNINTGKENAAFLSPVKNHTDYISAVFLQSYWNKKEFIITEMPLKSTIIEFWRMVYGQSCRTIVILNEQTHDDETEPYWPEDRESVIHGPFLIERVSTQNGNDFSAKSLKITMEKNNPLMTKLFQCHFWRDESPVAESTQSFLNLMQTIRKRHQNAKGSPIIVHCVSGAGKCGLFCAIWNIIDRIESDNLINVLQPVRQLKNVHQHFFHDLDQYEFCYRTAITYCMDNNIFYSIA